MIIRPNAKERPKFLTRDFHIPPELAAREWLGLDSPFTSPQLLIIGLTVAGAVYLALRY